MTRGPRLLAGVALAALLAAPTAAAHPPAPGRQARMAMGTVWEVEAEGPAPGRAVEAAFAAIRRLDEALSTYRPASALSRLNREGGHGWVPLPPEACGVLGRALGWARASGGAFDPTVGPLVAAWGFKHMDYRMPTPAALAAARARVGWRHVRLSAGRARFARPGMAVDLGAIAKGTAIDAALAAMRRAGATRARVDAGGQQGVWAPSGRPWRFAVRDPRDPDALLAVATLGRGSIATSSAADRGFTHGGRRYGHVIDPRTGAPAGTVLGVSVVAPTAEAADALSTALMVLGPSAGRRLLAAAPGRSALFVMPVPAGAVRLVATPGWPGISVPPAPAGAPGGWPRP